MGMASACAHIGRSVLQTAHRMGLNFSKVSQKAQVKAIKRQGGANLETGPKKSLGA